jgi:rare lipoprotein A (peptidoglycan hydrolase)
VNLDEYIRILLGLACTLLLGGGTESPTIPPIPHPQPSRPEVSIPPASVRVVQIPAATLVPISGSNWKKDPEVSWYGPGFYGKRTACGLTLTKTLYGVAHRTLPCGTLVEFRYQGKSSIVPVVDRGPYVDGRRWDLTGGLCVYLNHCFTGSIEWRFP